MSERPAVILNVNDDDAARYVMTRLLRRAGFEVLEAATGKQALYMVSQSPDLVVLDVNLPDMNGFEVCRQLRADSALSTLRVLHLSATHKDVAARVEGLEGGADAYLTQPVDPAELLATIRSLLRSSESERKARVAAEQWQATFDSFTDAVALMDHEGNVLKCNRAFAMLHKRAFSDLVGRPCPQQVPGAGERARAALRRLHADGGEAREVVEVEIEGQHFRVTRHPVYDADGGVAGVVQIYANTTDAKRASEALRESEERFRLLVSGVKEYAIFMLDPTGKIVSWNSGARSIKGYEPSEILGQHISCFYTPEMLKEGLPTEELARAAGLGQLRTEGFRVRKDGSWFWAEVLLTAVRDDVDKLRGFAVVTRDSTERKRLLEELKNRADALTEAGQRKDEFLAMLGHELRNPLAAIQTTVTLLEHLGPPDAKTGRIYGTIARQTKHLARLVDDLLDVSRITTGRIELRKEVMDVASAVSRVVEANRPLLEARRHDVVIKLPDEPLVLEADPLRFDQVLTNLLSNAAKYMEPGGRIWLKVERESSYAVLRVRDEGIGISAEMLPRVFDLFAQADTSLDRRAGGLGIGLTIVKSLVERHGGNVAAFSEGLGLGSEFVVRLPLHPVLADPAPKSASSPRTEEPGARRRTVLIVEDNVDAREALEHLLEFWGHTVVTAPDGETGLHRALSIRPDVMLLDVGLPGMDGYEVARKLRSLPAGQDIYLVAMTGYGSPEDKTRALEAGFHVHLVKPVEPAELSTLLNELWLVRRS